MNYITGFFSWVYTRPVINEVTENEIDGLDISENEVSENEMLEISENNEITEVEVNEKQVVIKPDIPLSTVHKGCIYYYYRITDPKIFNQIDDLYSLDIIDEISSIKGLFRWAFGRDKMDKFIKLSKNITQFDNVLLSIEDIRSNNPQIEYGNTKEFENNLKLDKHMIQKLTSDNPIIRMLYTFNWSFKLEITEDWKEAIKINEEDLLIVTKKPDRRKLYYDCIETYTECIEDAINFREKYYLLLTSSEPSININLEFLVKFTDLFEKLIEYLTIYNEFINCLNLFENKRFDEYKTKLKNYPSFNISFSNESKKVKT